MSDSDVTPSALRRTPPAKPDLIASGRLDTSAVLLHMSRRHANVLGAWLDGRASIARGHLPNEVMEILDALTLRLVAPPGHRWNDLRNILEGQPARVELNHALSHLANDSLDEQYQAPAPGAAAPSVMRQAERDPGYPLSGRHRRPYDGGPNGEDINQAAIMDQQARLPIDDPIFPPMLGDVDGTTVAEFEEQRMARLRGDTQTCYKCVPPADIGPGNIEHHNKTAHGGGKHLVPHVPDPSRIRPEICLREMGTTTGMSAVPYCSCSKCLKATEEA